MDSIVLGIVFLVLITIVFTPIINLYSAINTTLELITVKNRMKLKECKKVHRDVF